MKSATPLPAAPTQPLNPTPNYDALDLSYCQVLPNPFAVCRMDPNSAEELFSTSAHLPSRLLTMFPLSVCLADSFIADERTTERWSSSPRHLLYMAHLHTRSLCYSWLYHIYRFQRL